MPPQTHKTLTTLAAAFLLLLSLCTISKADTIAALEQPLRDRVMQWIHDDALSRDDGYIYAIDVTQLAIYAARAGDRALYEPMRTIIAKHLLVDDPSQAESRGYIAWRYQPGQPLDASGTTEALRAAQALWLGSSAFELPKDRELAVRILHGYARHQATDQNLWLIRNYYNLQTRSYATNSYLVDYAPDLLAEVAAQTGDKALTAVTTRSAQLVRQAVSPSGLIHQIVQPEVKTLMPRSTGIFSPNNIEQLANSATVAEEAAASCPQVAQQVLRFAVDKLPELHLWYDATTGEPAGDARAGLATHATLMRLAAKLNDPQAVDALRLKFHADLANLLQHDHPRNLYLAGQALLAIEACEK